MKSKEMPSKVSPTGTFAKRAEEVEPQLPHERDESFSDQKDQAVSVQEKGDQAYKDASGDTADTGRSNAMEETYQRLKADADAEFSSEQKSGEKQSTAPRRPPDIPDR
jgi:hypothetical protein